MRKILLLTGLFLALPNFLRSQSIGSGGMSFSGTIDGVYFNVSGDFKTNFAFNSDEASTQLRFNWFKVNYVTYNGVRYDATNHPGGNASFDYLSSGYTATIKLTEQIPTKGYVDRTKTAYPNSWMDFRFSAGGVGWENLTRERRLAHKEKWRSRTSPGTIFCTAVGGQEIRNIISAVKNRSKQGNNQQSTAGRNSSGGRNSGSNSGSNSSSTSGSNSNRSSGSTYNNGSSGSSRSSTNSNSQSSTRRSSSNNSNSSYKRQQEQYRKKQAEQEAQRRAYDDFMRAQNDRNQAYAAAGAMAGIGVLAIFGKLIYGGMGIFDPVDAYVPDAVNIKGSFQFGYSQLVQPMWFNSVYTNSFGTSERLEYTYAWPTCFGMGLDLGFEHDYAGIEGYASVRGGSSIFVTNYMLDVNYGFRAYAGLPWLQGYFEQGYGQRQLWMDDWITAEQSGEGYSDMIWENVKYGIRINWGDYVRSHLSVGVINEAVGRMTGRIQLLENFNPDYDPNSRGIFTGPRIGEVYSTKFVQGYFLEWKKDHSFNFFVQVYPNFPYTGEVSSQATPETVEENIDGGVFVNVGFVRSIDGFMELF